MARNKTFYDAWLEVTPDVDDNVIDDDPITCEIHPMSAEEYRSWSRQVAKQGGNKISEIELGIRITERVLKHRCRGVTNYTINGAPITTGADLFKRGESDVIDAVFGMIVDASKLDEVLKKKSKVLSASLFPTTPEFGDGGAQSARVTTSPMETIYATPETVPATDQNRGSHGIPSSPVALGRS